MLETIKSALQAQVRPAFKDARMTLEAVLSNSALGTELALTSAYAVALALDAPKLTELLGAGLEPARREQAEVAAAVMGMTNVYYSFVDTVAHDALLPDLKALPAQLRMVSYGQQAQKDKRGFEVACLAVSLANKCRPCIASHVHELKGLDFSTEQFRDLGRVSAAAHAVSKLLG